ncbi:MAG: Hsp33 family molecular chaperone HslO [Clostridiales bacterium]|jgi:molecular chaperone Hsp33|nr:Hsp33 family molecular chaperone HslO [Clostridiales bacterium]
MSYAVKYILNGDIVVTVIDSLSVLNTAARLHGLTPLSSAVLNRIMTAGLFLSQDLKNDGDRLSVSVGGSGPFKKAVVASDKKGLIKGYILNTSAECPLKDGKLDIDAAVGKDGYISVVKDLGLKEPYSGNSRIVTGDIAADFALYFTLSEQKPSAVALGEYLSGGKIKAAGGIFVQPLPGANDFLITAVQDVLRNFTDTGRIFYQSKTSDEIMEKYFGAFEIKKADEYKPRFFCGCSEAKTRKIIRLLGRQEAEATIAEQGVIEANCSFCNKTYRFKADELGAIFD